MIRIDDDEGEDGDDLDDEDDDTDPLPPLLESPVYEDAERCPSCGHLPVPGGRPGRTSLVGGRRVHSSASRWWILNP